MNDLDSPAFNCPASPIRRLVNSWNGFWFTPADPTPLGFIRLCAGLLIFYVHVAYTWDLQTMMGPYAWADLKTVNEMRREQPFVARPSDWSEELRDPKPAKTLEEEAYIEKYGVNPRDAHTQGYHVFSIWFHVTDVRWVLPVHIAMLVCIFLFAVGFCTRVTSVLAFLSVQSYIQRSQVVMFGMDTITNILMIYLMIGPSGAALSVDRLITRYWAMRRHLKKQRRAGAGLHLDDAALLSPPTPRVSANLALRLMNVHACFVYMASGLSKLLGPAWWNGTAIWGTMANPEFSPTWFPGYMQALVFLAQHRWLWEAFVSGGVMFTLAFEIGFGFLIWLPRWRWVMLCSAVMLHTGIAIFMGLNTFSLAMLILVSSGPFLRGFCGSPPRLRITVPPVDRLDNAFA